MNVYLCLYYVKLALQYKCAVKGSPTAFIGGWLTAKPACSKAKAA